MHMNQLVKSTSQDLGIDTQPPTFCQKLATCDFFLFTNVKDQCRETKYKTREGLCVAVTAALRLVSCDGSRDVFDRWLHSCHMCIKVKGPMLRKNK